MATSATAQHPAAEAHLQAARRRAAAEHHRHETAHEHNQGNRDEAEEHVTAADKHSEKAHELTAQAAKHF